MSPRSGRDCALRSEIVRMGAYLRLRRFRRSRRFFEPTFLRRLGLLIHCLVVFLLPPADLCRPSCLVTRIIRPDSAVVTTIPGRWNAQRPAGRPGAAVASSGSIDKPKAVPGHRIRPLPAPQPRPPSPDPERQIESSSTLLPDTTAPRSFFPMQKLGNCAIARAPVRR